MYIKSIYLLHEIHYSTVYNNEIYLKTIFMIINLNYLSFIEIMFTFLYLEMIQLNIYLYACKLL